MAPQRVSKTWRLCFGRIHICIATTLVGFGYLLISAFALTLLIILNLNQEKVMNGEGSLLDFDILNFLRDEVDGNNAIAAAYRAITDSYFKNHDALILLSFFFLACTVAITVFMLIGVLKKIPWFLLPFIFWQILDFIVTTCFLLFGYFWMVEAVDDYEETDIDDFILSELDLTSYEFFIIAAFFVLFVIFLKIYALCTVLRCLEYLAQTAEQKDSGVVYLVNRVYSGNRCAFITPTTANNRYMSDSESTVFLNERVI